MIKYEGLKVAKTMFILTILNVAYVISRSKPMEKEDETIEETRKHNQMEKMISRDVKNALKYKKEYKYQSATHLQIELGMR